MSTSEEKDRWSSQMISNGACAYLDAAKTLQANQLTAPQPFWFCIFQSIELSLKAFLRGKGFSKEDLKARDLGHRLSALYEAANLQGLKDVISLLPEEEVIVCTVGEMYSRKVFQYAETGWISLPYAYQAYSVAEKICSAIRPFAESSREHHYDKPTAVQ